MPVLDVRFLTLDDIAALMQLEQQKWSVKQLPSAEQLAERIQTHPHLNIGAFCRRTHQAKASLFMKPVAFVDIEQAFTWQDCAQIDTNARQSRCKDLFGISLSSMSAEATLAIFCFFYPYSIKQGWRSIYLGSPIPGYRQAVEQQPNLCVECYVRRRHRQMPIDPQLRYYHKRGFNQIISVQRDYFPHEESLNYGVIIRGDIPFSRWSPLLRYVPHQWLYRISAQVLRRIGG